MIIESELKNWFHIVHLDTSDRRSLTNIGKLDLKNICLALFHIFKLCILLIKIHPYIVYLPICQTVKGYLRDVAFIGISKIFGARVIIHLRGGYFRRLYENSNPFVKLVIKNSCKFVDRAIVLGETLRYIFEGLVPSEKIAVVPNGIEKDYITDEEIDRAIKKRYSKLNQFSVNHCQFPNSSALRILFLSNLLLTKGFFDVIKSVPIVIQNYGLMRNKSKAKEDIHPSLIGEGKSFEFVFAGERHDAESVYREVNDYIHKNNLEGFIKFYGPVKGKAKKELLLSSDIFVFPTYYYAEGQPWVIIEAMSAGLPIITADMGCIKEMVIDGENGFIIEKQNPALIAEKIIYLTKNPEIRRKMGEKSRERFLKYYTKDKFIDRLGRVFKEVLSEI